MSKQGSGDFVQLLVKRWWLFLILGAATVGALLITLRLKPPQYAAAVRFVVTAPPTVYVTLYPSGDQPNQNQQIATTEAAFTEMLKSPAVLHSTVEALHLTMSLSELARQITVEKPPQSEFTRVTVVANSPQQAADLANTLVDAGKQYYGRIQAEPAASSREFISAQVDDAYQQLQSVRQSLADFKTQHQISDLSAEIDSERQIISNLILANSNATVNNQRAQALAYTQLVGEHQAELQRLTQLSDEYLSLQDAIRRADNTYGFLRDKETEAKLKENEILRTGYIQVVEEAFPPLDPVSPIDFRILALGVIASQVLSALLALAWEYLETHRVRSREDAVATRAS